ncbi:MAG: hypothetical protein ACRBC3_12180 [Burkholderiaceae bacterium]
MKIFRVGGSVRDELLGLPFHDADWVVVGATPAQMTELGYQPVGKDFPVFLHPESHEEYALARTERKTGPGYKGFDVHFSPDVTLEEDLLRRDLTINAMARAEDGTLIDPYHGQSDLANRLFRHVSDAFSEDPVRILRLARFAARFADFSVAPETLALMRQMTAAGEVDALVAERVWQELARGLMEAAPARMMTVLADANALTRLIPGLKDLEQLEQALNRAAQAALSLPGRFALVALACDNGLELAAALRAPNECRDIARLLIQEKTRLFDDRSLADAASVAEPETLLGWIERLDGLRRPERLPVVMAAADAWAPGATGLLAARLSQSLQAVQTVNAGAIAKPLAPQGPAAIAAGLRAARLQAIGDSFRAKP